MKPARLYHRVALISVALMGVAHALTTGPVIKLNGALPNGGDTHDYVVSEDHKWVVYLADQEVDGVNELYCRPISGSGLPIKMNARLVGGGNVNAFAVSGDGARVVYLADQEKDDVFELYSRPPDGALDPIKLNGPLPTGGDVEFFEIAPNGKSVIYVANQDQPDTYDIYSRAIGGIATPVKLNGTLAKGGLIDSFEITSDSSRVVYRADQDAQERMELFSRTIDGKQGPVKLSGAMAATGEVGAYALTKDGRFVVYLADQEQDEVVELYISPADGGRAPVKLNGPLVRGGNVDRFKISPDGRWVVYVADQERDEVEELYARPADGGGKPVKLNGPLPVGGYIYSFRISPDGKSVAYVANQRGVELFEAFTRAIDGTGSDKKLNSTLVTGGDVKRIEFSKDGQRVLYLADQEQDDILELYSTLANGFGIPTRLSLAGGGSVKDFLVYPSHILIQADEDKKGQNNIYLRGLNNSEPPTKPHPPLGAGGNVENADITEDGQWLVYRADQDRDEVFEIYSVRIGQSSPGDLKWQVVTGGREHSSPAIGADGAIYVGSAGAVLAVDGATGAIKWSFRTGGDVKSSPALGGKGTVYVGSTDDKLYALDGATGVKKWEFVTKGDIESSPAVLVDETIYVGSYDGKLYAINGLTGAKKWEFPTGDLIISSPAIALDGTVYIGSRDEKVYAVDGATGAKKWEFATGAWVDSSPAIGPDGTIYVGSFDGRVYALDGLTGDLKWQFLTRGRVISSPTIGADGTVFVGSNDHKVYALDGATGAKKWEFLTEYVVNSSAAVIADGTIYIGSQDKKLYALDAATGKEKWDFLTGYNVDCSPAVGADGTVYIMSSDGILYAITGSATLAKSLWPKFHRSDQSQGSLGLPIGPPFLLFQTRNQLFAEGRPWDLRVVVGGTQPMNYEWFLNGKPLINTKEPRLAGATFSSANAGVYRVRVGNAQGSKESVDMDIKLGHQVSVGLVGPGRVRSAPDSLTHLPGTAVELSAQAHDGRRFEGWIGDMTSSENPLRVTANQSYQLYARFQCLPGDKKWEYTAGGGQMRSSAAVGPDGVIYVGSGDNFLHALDGVTGVKKWSFATGGDIESAPAMEASGTIYFGSTDGKVYAVDSSTGKKQWEFTATGPIYSSPAIGPDGTIYIGSKDTNLYALDRATGAKKWAFKTGHEVFSSPAIGANGLIYFGSRDGKVYALDAVSGTMKWEHKTGHQVLSSPAIGSNGTIYVGSNDKSVYALNGATGAPLWGFTTLASVTSSPAIGADGTIYIGSQDGALYALEGATGTKKWHYATGAVVHSSPAIGADGTVYIASYNGKLYAIDGVTGKKQWDFDGGTGEISASPAIGADGTVYIGTFGGVLYAVQGGSGLARSPWPKFRGGQANSGKPDSSPNPNPSPKPTPGGSTGAVAYSTFLGGAGHELSPDKDAGSDIAVDAQGNIYVTGMTNSRGRHDADIFVRKFDPSGSRLLYETYYDSNGSDDAAYGIAVDREGNAYVTGKYGDWLLWKGLGVFIAKLSPTGATIYQYAFGVDSSLGLSWDAGRDVTVDADGNAYIVGTTTWSLTEPFPTTQGAFQSEFGGGKEDAFVMKLNREGKLVYSTLLGGEGDDRGFEVAVDGEGNAYVIGDTDSDSDFPITKGAFQSEFGGARDIFVAKLNPSGSAVSYSTFLGGSGVETGQGIALDGLGNVLLTGFTAAVAMRDNDFPMVNAFQPVYGGTGSNSALANAFVVKLNSMGSALVYSSFMGGAGDVSSDGGHAIATDQEGNAYITGHTQTFPDTFTGVGFPIANAFQPKRGGATDGFLTKLSPEGKVIYSSYLGGNGDDAGFGIALGGNGNVYIAGTTTSPDFPILNAYQPKMNGGSCDKEACSDAFFMVIAQGVPDNKTPTALPALSIARQGSRVALSWPDTSVNYALEASNNLVAWMAEPTAPVNTDGKKQALIPILQAARFYRLRKP